VPDLEVLGKALRDLGAGAWLRGVEVTVDGEVAKDGQQFVLRIKGAKTMLRLKPLTKLVQRNQQPTGAEKTAYQKLTGKWKGQPLRARVVGPLVNHGMGQDAARNQSLALEVRKFELR
jgi:hypothetical protein